VVLVILALAWFRHLALAPDDRAASREARRFAGALNMPPRVRNRAANAGVSASAPASPYAAIRRTALARGGRRACTRAPEPLAAAAFAYAGHAPGDAIAPEADGSQRRYVRRVLACGGSRSSPIR
jgi:hypothetical protein